MSLTALTICGMCQCILPVSDQSKFILQIFLRAWCYLVVLKVLVRNFIFHFIAKSPHSGEKLKKIFGWLYNPSLLTNRLRSSQICQPIGLYLSFIINITLKSTIDIRPLCRQAKYLRCTALPPHPSMDTIFYLMLKKTLKKTSVLGQKNFL